MLNPREINFLQILTDFVVAYKGKSHLEALVLVDWLANYAGGPESSSLLNKVDPEDAITQRLLAEFEEHAGIYDDQVQHFTPDDFPLRMVKDLTHRLERFVEQARSNPEEYQTRKDLVLQAVSPLFGVPLGHGIALGWYDDADGFLFNPSDSDELPGGNRSRNGSREPCCGHCDAPDSSEEQPVPDAVVDSCRETWHDPYPGSVRDKIKQEALAEDIFLPGQVTTWRSPDLQRQLLAYLDQLLDRMDHDRLKPVLGDLFYEILLNYYTKNQLAEYAPTLARHENLSVVICQYLGRGPAAGLPKSLHVYRVPDRDNLLLVTAEELDHSQGFITTAAGTRLYCPLPEAMSPPEPVRDLQ